MLAITSDVHGFHRGFPSLIREKMAGLSVGLLDANGCDQTPVIPLFRLIDAECEPVGSGADPWSEIEVARHRAEPAALQELDSIDEKLCGEICLHPDHHPGEVIRYVSRGLIESGAVTACWKFRMTNPRGPIDVEPLISVRSGGVGDVMADRIRLQIRECGGCDRE